MPAGRGPAAPTFQLRPARRDDALCLAVLAMQVYLDTYATQGISPAIAREVQREFSQPVFEALLQRPGVLIEVAEQQGHLVGFAQTHVSAHHALAPAGSAAELFRLYVQEPFTAQGVGTALLQRAEQQAADGGRQVLWLTPWEHNHRALAFYARRGYLDCGHTLHLIEDVSHGNRVLAKRLATSPSHART